jgi:hypothetical protein
MQDSKLNLRKIAYFRSRLVKNELATIALIKDEILPELENLPEDIKDLLKKRIVEGLPIDSWTLGDIVLKLHDYVFFQEKLVRSSLKYNFDWLLKAMRNDFNYLEVEQDLLDRLKNEFEREGGVCREMSLKVLRDHGSTECLDTLYAIDYEFHGKYKTAEVSLGLSNNTVHAEDGFEAIPILFAKIEARALVAVGRALKEAIEQIEKRGSPPRIATTITDEKKPLFEQAFAYAKKAEESLNNDRNYSLNLIRKGLESTLKIVIRQKSITYKDPTPLDDQDLGKLIGLVMSQSGDNKPPKIIFQLMKHVQELGNFGSHDQGDSSPENLTNKDLVKGEIAKFREVVSFFEDDLKKTSCDDNN